MSTLAVMLLRLGAINGFLAVALGAFGAHSLKDRIAPEMLVTWKTGTEYHLTHALALLLVALLCDRLTAGGNAAATRQIRIVGMLFLVGIVLFSGSLYALAVSGMRPLGVVTPFGGLCFLSGWLLLFFTVRPER